MKKAISESQSFVMKPQREGVGNNLYGKEIENALKTLSPIQRSGYILMDRILPPPVEVNFLREGQLATSLGVSELGIYGLFLRFILFYTAHVC